MRVPAVFRGRSLLWATTYSFDPDLFAQFLLRRLGEPPRNVVVLADHRRLSETWERIHHEPWRLSAANSLYLVRGIEAPAAFHPKTYFAGDAKRGTLLVGSGNLTLDGIERGHEVFARFDSDDEGLGTILAWSRWMEQVVGGLDAAVRDRWIALKRTASWLRGDPPEPTPLLTNFETPLLDQLRVTVGTGIRELHVAAPFFDREGAAFGELLERLEPEQVHLYVCRQASVDGESLLGRIRRLGVPVRLWRYESDFVHAKLIACVLAEEDAIVMTGSPNLSGGALLEVGGPGGRGNLEVALVTRMASEPARALLRPPGVRVEEADLGEAGALSFTPDEPTDVAPLTRLLWARFIEDGHLEIGWAGDRSAQGLSLAHPEGLVELDAGRSSEPVEIDRDSAVVWLAHEDGTRASNVVPVDDPEALAAQLSEGKRRDRPRELDLADLETPVGRMLARLQAECIFDLDETSTSIKATGGETASDAIDDELWERLQREELELDPRVSAYRSFRINAGGTDDEILLRLQAMLGQVPLRETLSPIGGSEAKGRDGEGGRGEPWSPERRLRLRLFNALKRWCAALADPRFFWISLDAGVRNYVALLGALTECWRESYLPEDRLRDLLGTLLESFVRGERRRGYLWLLDEDERAEAIAAIPVGARELAAALIYAVFHDEDVAHPYIFEWQTFLVPALEHGIVMPGEGTRAVVRDLAGDERSVADVEDRLLAVASYINDERWCERMQRELGFDEVRLATGSYKGTRFVLRLDPDVDLLNDPRLPRLVRETLDYRRSEAALLVEAGRDRLRVEREGKAGIRIGGAAPRILTDVLRSEDLRRLDARARPFADLAPKQKAA